MTSLESIPFVGWLISWYKTSRDEKRAGATVTITFEKRQDGRGIIDLYFAIRTDATIQDVTVTYKVDTSIEGYGKEETHIRVDAIMSGEPIEELALRVKVQPADAIRAKKAEIRIPVTAEYSLKTGEKRSISRTGTMSRGQSEFVIS